MNSWCNSFQFDSQPSITGTTLALSLGIVWYSFIDSAVVRSMQWPRPTEREIQWLMQSSSLSDLNSKSLISLQFAFSCLTENCNDINMLAIRSPPSPTGC